MNGSGLQQLLQNPVSTASKKSSWTYRPDIDALRGIAVLAVILYHFNEAWLPGGFTGVDVFFVISGYVVTGSLIKHQGESLGSQLGGFYLRRIRRLMPNLLLMVGLTSIGMALLVPPSETRRMFTAASKSLYGWSNNFFALNGTDYFAQDANLNPLSHTWSLGVEEQFYLLFPLLILVMARWLRPARVVQVLLGLITASLVLSLVWTAQAPNLAFFLMPSRFWELSAGALLLLAQRQNWLSACQGPRVLVGARLLGVGLLVLALLTTSSEQGFPAPGALPAVVATLLLLHAGSDWSVLQRPLVQLGLLSYSLYLWHWPVLTLMRWTTGLDQPVLMLLALGLMVALAWGAYRFVETPCRRWSLPVLWQGVLALAAVVLTWCGLDALGFTYRGAVFQGSRSAFVPKSDRFSLGGCTVDPWVTYGPDTRTDLVKCSQPGSNPAAGEIFLMGDSHALAMLPMLKTAAKSTGQSVTYSFKGSCLNSSRLIPTLRKKAYGPCVGYSRGEFERTLNRLNPGDSLMISNWFNVYLTDITVKGRANTYPYVVDGERLEDHAKVREIYIADMRALASQLQQKGINLILVVDPPVLRREPVACEAWAHLQGPENRSLLCSADPEIVAQMQQTQRDVFAAVAQGHPNVRLFDPTEEFLQNGRVTHLLPDGQLRYFDSNHMTISGSQSLAPRFLDFLRANGLDRSNAG